MNGKKPLTLDFKSFVESIGLYYAKDAYVSHPSPEPVKAELAKIVLGENYSFTEQVNNSATLCRLSPHRDKGIVPGPQDPERNIQLVGMVLPSTLDEETRKSQPFPKGTKSDPKDSVGNKQPIDKGLPSMVSDQGVAKTTLLPEGPLRDKDSWGNKTPADMKAINPTVTDLLRTSAKYQVDETQSTRLRYQTLTKNKGKTSFKVEPDLETLALTNLADIQAYLLSKDELAQESDEEEVFAAGDDVSPGSESRPPMLNKENYVPWSFRLLRYAKSRPNGKLIHNSILNGPYVRKMIPKPAGFENKENYVPWSSHLLRYAKSRPNGKLIHNSILNGPYVRKMIPEPGDANRDITITETFHLQTDDELFDKELKQIEVDDQAIQTILLGLPEDIYAVVDSCETAQKIWLRVQQMMKGSDIRIQERRPSCSMNGKGLLPMKGNQLSLTIIVSWS
nr:hypothetical protein [Tanacetum cinerariifolium]